MDNHRVIYLFGVLSNSNLRGTKCEIERSVLLDACNFSIEPRDVNGIGN